MRAGMSAFGLRDIGKTRPMTGTPDGPSIRQEDRRDSIGDVAGSRGTDQRTEQVNPAQNPAPSSPEPDREAVKKGEETLERVKPY